MRDDVARTVRREGMPPIYLLYGEDAYSRSRCADELSDAVSKMHNGADVNSFHAATAAFEDMVAAVMTVPMFSGARTVLIRGFEEMSSADQGRFIGVIAPGVGKDEALVAPNTTVIITSASKAIPRKQVSAAGSNIAAFEFRAAFARDAQAFVLSRAKEIGLTIEPAAAAMLLEMTGTDLGALAGELDKLLTYLGSGGRRITSEHVQAAVGKSSSLTVFTFCDAVIAGDASAAHAAHADLVRSNVSALAVQATLVSQLRLVIKARADMDRGMSPQGRTFPEKKAIQQAARLSQGIAAGMIARTARADRDIKTGVMSESLAMDLLVSDLCTKQKLQ